VRHILFKRFKLLPHIILSLTFATKINCISIHDVGGEQLSSGNLFCHLEQPLSKNTIKRRYLNEIEFIQAYIYILFNYDELKSFAQ
jgi:hypothetical protein